MPDIMTVEATAPAQEFTQIADDKQIEQTARALEANGIRTLIAEDGAEARRMFFELVPEGAEVYLSASETLQDLGITEEIDKSGRYDAIRPKRMAMDRRTQAREIRKLGAAPDYAAGSVHAVTEDGQVLIASNGGDVWYLLAAKFVGTVIACAVVLLIRRASTRLGLIVALALAFFQFSLLLYLLFA